jgi:hypothetical protein
MKIDQHPFATNMVDMAKEKSLLQTKILTSSSAKKSGAIDPKAQIAADEVSKGRICRKRPDVLRHHEGVSPMLLNKFQRDRKKTTA